MTIDNLTLPLWRSRRLRTFALLTTLVLTGLTLTVQALIPSQPVTEHWVRVNNEMLVHKIGLAGKIAPHKTVIVTAPFDGNIQTLLVEPGQRVQQGQTLLTLDPAAIEMQLRDALAVQLKAQRLLQELRDWESGVQVTRARRAVRAADLLINNLQRQIRDSQHLLERGIIARNELDDLQRQLQMQSLERVAAQNELQQALDQGAAEHRHIAEMELKNATVKYDALKALLDRQTIVAPFTGVIVPASDSLPPGAATAGPLQAGTRLNQGQALFAIADIEQLKIVALVSELDINQLHPGQDVEIEGDGFEGERLTGTVQVVSNLAQASDEENARAIFSVTLSIPKLTPEQLRLVRLGMSSRLSIITYRNEQAIVISPQAIRQEGAAKVVDYRETMDRPIQQTTVITGRSTLNGVEVFGLSPGFVRMGNHDELL
jgi:multidrug resistance efflux pump